LVLGNPAYSEATGQGPRRVHGTGFDQTVAACRPDRRQLLVFAASNWCGEPASRPWPKWYAVFGIFTLFREHKMRNQYGVKMVLNLVTVAGLQYDFELVVSRVVQVVTFQMVKYFRCSNIVVRDTNISYTIKLQLGKTLLQRVEKRRVSQKIVEIFGS
jgi:hypothetical protein